MIEIPRHSVVSEDPDGDDDLVPLRLNLTLQILLALANVLPTVVYYRFKNSKTRTATDNIILTLSLTDILSALASVTLSLTVHYERYDFGARKLACLVHQSAVNCFQLISSGLVTFGCCSHLTSLRDVTIKKSQQLLTTTASTGCCENKRGRIAIATVCACAVCVSSLHFFGFAPESRSLSKCRSCLVMMPSNAYEHIFFFVFLSGILANITATCLAVGLIVYFLWKSQRRSSLLSDEMEDRSERHSLVLGCFIIVTVATFHCLIWCPAIILLIMFRSNVAISNMAAGYAIFGTTMAGLANPVIYGLYSLSYRRGYGKALLAASKCLFGCPLSSTRHAENESTWNFRSSSFAARCSMPFPDDPATLDMRTTRSFDVRTNVGDEPFNYDHASVNPCDHDDVTDMLERTYAEDGSLSYKDRNDDDDGDDDSSLSLISDDSDNPEEDGIMPGVAQQCVRPVGIVQASTRKLTQVFLGSFTSRTKL